MTLIVRQSLVCFYIERIMTLNKYALSCVFHTRLPKTDCWLYRRLDKIDTVTLHRIDAGHYIIDFLMKDKYDYYTFKVAFTNYGDALLWLRRREHYNKFPLINKCEIKLDEQQRKKTIS